MKRQSKLNLNESQLHTGAEQQQTQNTSALEFASADDMLRYDAAHTPVPDRIIQRLQKSAESIPPPPRSWWHRLFRRSD